MKETLTQDEIFGTANATDFERTAFTKIPQPFIFAVIQKPTPQEALMEMHLSERAGAHAFELNLAWMRNEYRTAKALAPLFRRTTLPTVTTYRRYGREATDPGATAPADDVARMELQLQLVDVGCSGYDLELDTFDPQPRHDMSTQEGLANAMDPDSYPAEVTEDSEAVEKQMRLVEETHNRGGEVLASTHALTRLPIDKALWICKLAEERGCDALKIVRFNAIMEDIVDTLATTVALRRQGDIPFVMMAMGECGKLARITSALMGSMLVHSKRDYWPGAFTDQPLIRDVKAAFESIDYKINQRAEEVWPEWFAQPEIDSSIDLKSLLNGQLK